MSEAIEGVVSKVIPEDTVDRIVVESIGVIIIGMMVITEVGTGLEKDCFQEIMAVTELGSMSSSRLRSGSRASTNRDRIRYYNCREYDHFARDCPTCKKKEI